MFYKAAKSSDGTFYVPSDPEAPLYFRYDAEMRNSGLGGNWVFIDMKSGKRLGLRGPWVSNYRALYEATGLDLRARASQ